MGAPARHSSQYSSRGGCCVLCSRVAGDAATSYAYLAQLAQFSYLRPHLLDSQPTHRGLGGRHALVERKKNRFRPFLCVSRCTRLLHHAVDSSCRTCRTLLPSPPSTPHPSTPSHACSPALLSSLARVQYDRTPLHYATMYGRTPTVALLLEKGADVRAKDIVSGGCRDVWAPSARIAAHIAAVVAAVCCAVVSQTVQRRRTRIWHNSRNFLI